MKTCLKIKSLLITLIMLLLAVSAFAQDREMLLFQEIPEVITASRVVQKITDAPAVISIITDEEIKKYGARTLADILKILPGLTFRQAGTKMIVYPRGLTTSSNNSLMLVMLDGRPLNYPLKGDFSVNYKFPINHVKRIEVIKGPGSALYGANAFAGIINIITKDAADIDKTGLRASYGSDFTRYFDMDMKFEDLSGGGNAVIFLYDYETSGKRLVNDNEEVSVNDIYAKYKVKNTTLTAGITHVDEGIAGKLTNPSDDENRQIDSSFMDLHYKREITPDIDFSFRGYANYQKEISVDSIFENSVFGNDTQFTFNVNEYNVLVAGFDLRDSRTKSRGGEIYKANIAAGFIQDEMKLSDILSVTFGGRYDTHSVYEDVFSPRVGAVCKVNDDFVLKVSFGEAFRAPSFTDLYIDVYPYGVDGGMHIVSNEDLKPEKIQTVEAGIEARFADKLVLNVTGFHNYSRDLITLDSPGPPTYSEFPMVNKDRVTAAGVEAGFKGMLTNRIEYFANYTYQDVQDKETEIRLDYSPWYTANAGFCLSLFDYLSLSMKAHNVGERTYTHHDDMGGSETREFDSYTISDMNLMAEYNDVSVAFSVYNLGAKKYYYDTESYPMPGRSWLLTFSTKL